MLSWSFWTSEVQINDNLRSTLNKLEHKNISTDICSYFMEMGEINPF